MKRTSGLLLISLSLLLGLSQGAQAYTDKYVYDSCSTTANQAANFFETDNLTYANEGFFYRLEDQDYVYARVGLCGWAHVWATGRWGSGGTKDNQYVQMVKTTHYRYDGPAGSEPGVTITPKYAGWGFVDVNSCIRYDPQDHRVMFFPTSPGPEPKPLPIYSYVESHGRSLGTGSAVGVQKVTASTELCSFAQNPTFTLPSNPKPLVYRPGENLDVPSFPPPQNYQDGSQYFPGVAGRGIPDVLVPNSSTSTSLVYAGIIDDWSGDGLMCNRYGVWRIGKWSRSGTECLTPWSFDANAPYHNTSNINPYRPDFDDPWYNATPATVSDWWTSPPIQIPVGTANFVITAEGNASLPHTTFNTQCGTTFGRVYFPGGGIPPDNTGYIIYAEGDTEVYAGGGARATMKAELCIN